MSEQNETRTLKCPKCSSAMEVVTVEEIDVDRCKGCCGIFFDICEHSDLAQLETEPFDQQPSTEHNTMDDIDNIKCPVCDVDMLRLVAIRRRDIRYEKCPLCSGVYFDAGEFTEFKQNDESLLGIITKMLRGS